MTDIISNALVKVQDIIVDSKAGRILSGVSFWDNMVKDNIEKLDVYVEELEPNSIYEIDSVKDYNKLEEILKEECER